MEEKKQTKMKKSTKYLLIGTLVLFLSVLGASMAYYLARVSGNLSGRAAGTELTINVQKISSNATGDLIPLDNDLETLNLAAAGYQDKGACVDINGYSVCQIYHITLTNNGSVPLTVNGTVTLSGQNVPNIDCATMSDATTVANNNSCMGGNVFVSGDELPANDSNDYYVMVYINNLDEPQTDSGAFNGTVTFESTQGDKVKGRFTKPFNLVEHINELWNLNGGTTDNPTAKTEVVNNSITYLYATNVGLMRDRMGGNTTVTDVNYGNYRYYGENPNNYIDIGDKTEIATEVGNWVNIGENFNNSSECQAVFNCSVLYSELGFTTEEECENGVDSIIEQEAGSLGIHTLNDICDTTTVPAGIPILWRIIEVTGDERIRIIRNESIGNYSYDTSASDVNYGQGINQWGPSGNYEGADLMKLLNPGYETNTDQKCVWNSDLGQYDCENEPGLINNSLYWNSSSGSCYEGTGNTYKTCDFTNAGLSEEAKQYVIDQTLCLGGFDSYGIFANVAYNLERADLVVQNPSDGITRTTRWTGKVGLPYPSDFGYAADFRDSDCQGDLSTFGSCSANWMNQGYTLNPSVYDASGVLYFNHGPLTGGSASESYDVYPTLLLDSSVLAESGNGSLEHPYVLSGN